MGKLTFNGKDITKPFDYNGKKVVKITSGTKILSLQKLTKTITFNHYTSVSYDFSTDAIKISGYTGTVFDDASTELNNLSSILIIEFKKIVGFHGHSIKIVDRTTGKGWEINFNTQDNIDYIFTAGHKYQFENGKDPVDLGEFAPHIYHTEYTDIDTSDSSVVVLTDLNSAGWNSFENLDNPFAAYILDKQIIVEFTKQLTFTKQDNTIHIKLSDGNTKEMNIYINGIDTLTLKAGRKYFFNAKNAPLDFGAY